MAQASHSRARQSAVRPRTPAGALPLAGKCKVATPSGGGRAPWFIAGLGARGLVYHALLARWVADAVLDDDVSAIPDAVRRDATRAAGRRRE